MLRAIRLSFARDIPAKEKMPAVGRVIDRKPAFAALDVDQSSWSFDKSGHTLLPDATGCREAYRARASLRWSLMTWRSICRATSAPSLETRSGSLM